MYDISVDYRANQTEAFGLLLVLLSQSICLNLSNVLVRENRWALDAVHSTDKKIILPLLCSTLNLLINSIHPQTPWSMLPYSHTFLGKDVVAVQVQTAVQVLLVLLD